MKSFKARKNICAFLLTISRKTIEIIERLLTNVNISLWFIALLTILILCWMNMMKFCRQCFRSSCQQYLSCYLPNLDETLKVGFRGPSRTDSNCHIDICPGNLFPGDICPYQEYLNCYRPDFDKTLNSSSREHLEHIPTITVTFVQATFVLATFVHIRNISTVTDPILMKL